jgi:hypothetical protein
MQKFMDSYFAPTRKQNFILIRAICQTEVSILHLDVPMCFENFAFLQSEEDIYILEQYLSLIRNRFFLFAETAHTGVTLWERDPGHPDQPNVPRQFRFQTQLPESERVQHSSRASTPGSSGVSPPATRADFLLDLPGKNPIPNPLIGAQFGKPQTGRTRNGPRDIS